MKTAFVECSAKDSALSILHQNAMMSIVGSAFYLCVVNAALYT